MSEKHVIPDYDLLAKYFAGEVSTDQIKQIEDWVAESADNKKSFDRIHFLWTQSAKTEIVKKVNVDEAWSKMQFKMNASKQASKPKPEVKEVNIFSKTGKRLLQFAAIIIIAFGVGTIMRFLNSNNEISTQSQLAAVDLTLPDKSEIKLNKESKISYPEKFKGSERKVKLQGEAFFDIKPNKEKPFIVEADVATIKVLGTSFNIQAYDSTNIIEVTVRTGRVELSSKTQKVVLVKGDIGKVNKTTGEVTKVAKQAEPEPLWFTRKLIFKDTELRIVSDMLSKAYAIDIDFKSEAPKYCKWTCTFENAKIEDIMLLMDNSFEGISVKKQNNKYVITGKTCK